MQKIGNTSSKIKIQMNNFTLNLQTLISREEQQPTTQRKKSKTQRTQRTKSNIEELSPFKVVNKSKKQKQSNNYDERMATTNIITKKESHNKSHNNNNNKQSHNLNNKQSHYQQPLSTTSKQLKNRQSLSGNVYSSNIKKSDKTNKVSQKTTTKKVNNLQSHFTQYTQRPNTNHTKISRMATSPNVNYKSDRLRYQSLSKSKSKSLSRQKSRQNSRSHKKVQKQRISQLNTKRSKSRSTCQIRTERSHTFRSTDKIKNKQPNIKFTQKSIQKHKHTEKSIQKHKQRKQSKNQQRQRKSLDNCSTNNKNRSKSRQKLYTQFFQRKPLDNKYFNSNTQCNYQKQNSSNKKYKLQKSVFGSSQEFCFLDPKLTSNKFNQKEKQKQKQKQKEKKVRKSSKGKIIQFSDKNETKPKKTKKVKGKKSDGETLKVNYSKSSLPFNYNASSSIHQQKGKQKQQYDNQMTIKHSNKKKRQQKYQKFEQRSQKHQQISQRSKIKIQQLSQDKKPLPESGFKKKKNKGIIQKLFEQSDSQKVIQNTSNLYQNQEDKRQTAILSKTQGINSEQRQIEKSNQNSSSQNRKITNLVNNKKLTIQTQFYHVQKKRFQFENNKLSAKFLQQNGKINLVNVNANEQQSSSRQLLNHQSLKAQINSSQKRQLNKKQQESFNNKYEQKSPLVRSEKSIKQQIMQDKIRLFDLKQQRQHKHSIKRVSQQGNYRNQVQNEHSLNINNKNPQPQQEQIDQSSFNYLLNLKNQLSQVKSQNIKKISLSQLDDSQGQCDNEQDASENDTSENNESKEQTVENQEQQQLRELEQMNTMIENIIDTGSGFDGQKTSNDININSYRLGQDSNNKKNYKQLLNKAKELKKEWNCLKMQNCYDHKNKFGESTSLNQAESQPIQNKFQRTGINIGIKQKQQKKPKSLDLLQLLFSNTSNQSPIDRKQQEKSLQNSKHSLNKQFQSHSSTDIAKTNNQKQVNNNINFHLQFSSFSSTSSNYGLQNKQKVISSMSLKKPRKSIQQQFNIAKNLSNKKLLQELNLFETLQKSLQHSLIQHGNFHQNQKDEIYQEEDSIENEIKQQFALNLQQNGNSIKVNHNENQQIKTNKNDSKQQNPFKQTTNQLKYIIELSQQKKELLNPFDSNNKNDSPLLSNDSTSFKRATQQNMLVQQFDQKQHIEQTRVDKDRDKNQLADKQLRLKQDYSQNMQFLNQDSHHVDKKYNYNQNYLNNYNNNQDYLNDKDQHLKATSTNHHLIDNDDSSLSLYHQQNILQMKKCQYSHLSLQFQKQMQEYLKDNSSCEKSISKNHIKQHKQSSANNSSRSDDFFYYAKNLNNTSTEARYNNEQQQQQHNSQHIVKRNNNNSISQKVSLPDLIKQMPIQMVQNLPQPHSQNHSDIIMSQLIIYVQNTLIDQFMLILNQNKNILHKYLYFVSNCNIVTFDNKYHDESHNGEINLFNNSNNKDTHHKQHQLSVNHNNNNYPSFSQNTQNNNQRQINEQMFKEYLQSKIQASNLYVYNLSNELIMFIKKSQDNLLQFLKNINRSFGLKPIKTLKWIRKAFSENNAQENDSQEKQEQQQNDEMSQSEHIEAVLSPNLLAEFDNYQNQQVFEQINQQQYYLNHAVYASLNEICDCLRPYGETGQPVIPRYKISPYKQISSIENKILSKFSRIIELRMGRSAFDENQQPMKIITQSYKRMDLMIVEEQHEKWTEKNLEDIVFQSQYYLASQVVDLIFNQEILEVYKVIYP